MKSELALMPDFSVGQSGICINKLSSYALLEEIDALIASNFDLPVEHYVDMPDNDFREIVAKAQDELNRKDLVRRLALDQREAITRIVQSDQISIQSNLYLRATRPQTNPATQENVGWHRESFYGQNMMAAVNYWMPIRNVNPESTIRYIPESHLIPDDDILTVNEDDNSIERFSAGHKIGLLYSPKRIISGVDVSKSRPMLVTPGEVALFSGQLIHGSAVNKSTAIRFSIDFRLIADINMPTRKQHFASGRPYFEPL